MLGECAEAKGNHLMERGGYLIAPHTKSATHPFRNGILHEKVRLVNDKLASEIQAKIDEGDTFLSEDRFALAVKCYEQAAALLPEPRNAHAISLQVYLALGEGYFFSGYYDQALVAFQQAMKTSGGIENPLTHLRMGQSYFEIGELDSAADSLTRSYALDGRTIFDGEDEKYLSFLASRIDL
ncbi:tetratricopeptide repeat protein : Uncharacterized protein OS=Pedobacter sp. BAL39 GN=PBAL39_25435 PE=4 SV=1: TPR_2: TPR_11 [Tuwongella immobilis]|uniref:Uncharacterized protein n=2 Tax=Tuwongella immobilis TaxID=692036 RepID=A0A6C2YKX9_9BACT|nr:tetratricopeptide repeat protein : Uncharacterized protein OS=Pedobacter sp. BAL39 GN=PBAL39_25435 PE=4 SV=1: TPR_2: TPR_11 [Tuwongella immobilis]VTS00344.1 tetratricopeptide repeat protein : Uncharacterized protein OS=Pedobacter sp. BAL39 GN=PBAL39_25435 PE=4 SV=1: TPR_2: TPR_11 [Tuwongella immobilis]